MEYVAVEINHGLDYAYCVPCAYRYLPGLVRGGGEREVGDGKGGDREGGTFDLQKLTVIFQVPIVNI
jgi:hypothetical protein